jgi:hypothetical protein
LEEAEVEARHGALIIAQEKARETAASTIEINIRDEAGALSGHAVVTFTSSRQN